MTSDTIETISSRAPKGNTYGEGSEIRYVESVPYKDPEKRKEYHRQYWRNHYYADIEASRAEGRERYHTYKDPVKQRARHKERMATDTEYRDRQRETKNAYNKRNLANQKRRARAANAAVIENVDRFVVAEHYGWICQLCDDPIDPNEPFRLDDGSYNPAYLHIDHIISLSNGGDHSYANCQPAHARCNWSKHNTD